MLRVSREYVHTESHSRATYRLTGMMLCSRSPRRSYASTSRRFAPVDDSLADRALSRLGLGSVRDPPTTSRQVQLNKLFGTLDRTGLGLIRTEELESMGQVTACVD